MTTVQMRMLLCVADMGRDAPAAAAELHSQTSSDAPRSPSIISAASRAPCAESGSIQVTCSTWRETTANSSVRPTSWRSNLPVSCVHFARSVRCLKPIIVPSSKMGTVTNGFDARLADRPFLVFDFRALWRSIGQS